MAIDIFSIQPHEVSRDLKGYTVLLFGEPKSGKTTTACKFPKPLLLAFETGYLAIPGVMAQPITKWSEFKQVLKQLKEDKAHESFENIIIDTCDIAYDLCEKFVCNNNGVSSIGDLPFGKGYNLAKKEFDEALRMIPAMGYGLVLISHSQDKVFKEKLCETSIKELTKMAKERRAGSLGYAEAMLIIYNKRLKNGLAWTDLYKNKADKKRRKDTDVSSSTTKE